jgi:hypothetical protein
MRPARSWLMETITTQLDQIIGGAGTGIPGWSTQDIQNARPANNLVTSPPRDHGFQTTTPMVNSQSWEPPSSVFSAMGM